MHLVVVLEKVAYIYFTTGAVKYFWLKLKFNQNKDIFQIHLHFSKMCIWNKGIPKIKQMITQVKTRGKKSWNFLLSSDVLFWPVFSKSCYPINTVRQIRQMLRYYLPQMHNQLLN